MKGFFPLPAWLMPRPDLSWQSKCLFAVLSRHARRGERVANPAIELLCTDMGSPRRSVERWLAELEHVGLIERRRTGRECEYSLAGEPDQMPAISGASDTPSTASQVGAKSGASDAPTVGASDTPTVGASGAATPLSKLEIRRSPELARARESMRSALGARVEVRPIESLVARWLCEGAKSKTGKPWMDLEQLLDALRGGGLRQHHGHADLVRAVASWAELHADPETAVAGAIDGWSRDSWVRSRGWPMGALAKDPAKYLAIASGSAASSAPGDFTNADEDPFGEPETPSPEMHA